MRLLVVLAVAVALSACVSVPEATLCQPPPGELLIPAPPLPRLDDSKPMSQQDVIVAWLADSKSYRLLAERHSRLAAWGLTQCKWSTEVAAAEPSMISPAVTPVDTMTEPLQDVVKRITVAPVDVALDVTFAENTTLLEYDPTKFSMATESTQCCGDDGDVNKLKLIFH